MSDMVLSKNYRKTRLLIIIFQLTYLKITILPDSPSSDRHHIHPYWIYWHSCNHLDFKREFLFRFLTGKLCPLSMLSKTRRFTSAKNCKNHPTSESEQGETSEHPRSTRWKQLSPLMSRTEAILLPKLWWRKCSWMTQWVVDRWEWCIQECTHGTSPFKDQTSTGIPRPYLDLHRAVQKNRTGSVPGSEWLHHRDLKSHPTHVFRCSWENRFVRKWGSPKKSNALSSFSPFKSHFFGGAQPIFSSTKFAQSTTTRCSNRLLLAGAASGSKPETGSAAGECPGCQVRIMAWLWVFKPWQFRTWT